MAFFRDFFGLIDQAQARAELQQTDRMAASTEQVVDKTVTNSRRKLSAIGRGVIAGYRLVEDLLSAFGYTSTALNAMVSGIYPIVASLSALEAAYASNVATARWRSRLGCNRLALNVVIFGCTVQHADRSKHQRCQTRHGRCRGIANAWRYI